jgi:hypothetical protein
MKRIALPALVCVFSVLMCAAQDGTHDVKDETKADVPALGQFHVVIYKIWHTAWPKKDVALLASLLPDVQKRTADIAETTLPGILRDRKPAWDNRVTLLRQTVEQYRAAVESKNDQGLVDAAEALHTQYEQLVRVIRPALPEIEEFHAALYLLYHYYLPDYDIQKIRASIDLLTEKMAALNNASLPERMKVREARFLAQRASLSNAVRFLEPAFNSGKKEGIISAIEHVHSDYQGLEKVFE